jgi:hypothetical protein
MNISSKTSAGLRSKRDVRAHNRSGNLIASFHSENGLRDHRYRSDLKVMRPPAASCIAQRRDPGQELTERDTVGIGAVHKPAPPHHELLAEIARWATGPQRM